MKVTKNREVFEEKRPNTNPNTSPLLQLVTFISLFFVALPIFYLVKRALQSELATLQIVIFRFKTLEVLLTTISLVLLVATFATLLGLAIAWSLNSISLPGNAILRALVILPIAIPSYVFTYAWLSLGFLPSGFIAAVVVLTLSTTPYVTLAVMAALRRIDSSQLDVARTLGLNQLHTLLKITLPQIRNAVGAGALLVSLYVLSDFGAVSLLGVDTFTRSIQNTYQGSFDRSSASVLALMLVAISASVIFMENRSRQKSITVKSSVSLTKRISQIDARPVRAISLTLLITYISLSLALPISVLIYRFLSRPTGLDIASLGSAAFSTVTVSFLGAVIALLLALPIALLAAREVQLGRLAERGVLLVNALPGIVMGLALVSLGSDLPFVYQTLGLLALSYSILFLARSVGSIRTSIAKVPIQLTEIAATLGQTRSRVFLRVTLPLAAPGVLTGTLLVFLSAMKELPATLMLRPTGFETLATEMWSNTAIFRFSEAAPYALLLVLIAAIPTFLISRPDRELSERGELQ